LPFEGSPQTIPGIVEAEWYDTGGQGIAYNDDNVHQGSSFRNDEDVDVVDKQNASNLYAVGYTEAGEWTEYTVNVTEGTYDITLSYASNLAAPGDLRISLDGVEIALFDQLINLGTWVNFSDITINNIDLPEAQSAVLRIELVGAGNLDYDALTFTTVLPPEPLSLSNDLVSETPMQYHKTTISWDGPALIEGGNTNTDYRLDVQIVSPIGEIYNVPGYFAADGNAGETSANFGNKWRCHFLPQEVGTYSYTATLRSGSNIAFSDSPETDALEAILSTGTFSAIATDKDGDDFRGKGKLEYVGEHHLRFSNGEYFLKVGPNSPEVFLEFADFDGTNSPRDYGTHLVEWNAGDPEWQDGKGRAIIGAVNYLTDLGLSAHYFMSMNAYGDGNRAYPWTGRDDYLTYDCSKLDQWQIVFDHMMSKGMMCNIIMSEQENQSYFEFKEGQLGGFADSRKVYYREMVARFGYLNAVTFNIGEESGWDNSNTYGEGLTTTQRIAFGDHLRSLLYYEDNLTIHNGPSNNDDIFDGLLGVPSYSGVSYQGLYNQDIYGRTKILEQIQSSAASGHPWVVSYDEPYVGSSNIDLASFRRNALWPALTAGAAGVEVYVGGGQDQGLQDYHQFSTYWDMLSTARDFFLDNEVPFYEMNNQDSVLNDGMCLADDGEHYVVYLENGGSANITLPNATDVYTVSWYDPRNGGDLQSGDVTTISGTSPTSIGFAPSSVTDDWVVLITRDVVTCVGDINIDGIVDIQDFLILNSFFGQTCDGCAADLDQNGLIDVNDFVLFNSAFGNVCN